MKRFVYQLPDEPMVFTLDEVGALTGTPASNVSGEVGNWKRWPTLSVTIPTVEAVANLCRIRDTLATPQMVADLIINGTGSIRMILRSRADATVARYIEEFGQEPEALVCAVFCGLAVFTADDPPNIGYSIFCNVGFGAFASVPREVREVRPVPFFPFTVSYQDVRGVAFVPELTSSPAARSQLARDLGDLLSPTVI